MINWSNNSALAGFQNAMALGADIGGAIKQHREDSALGAFLEASRGPASTPATGALTAQVQRPTSDVAGVGDVMGGMIATGGNGIVATPEQQSASEAAYARLAKINPRLAMQAQDRVASQQEKRAKLMQEQRANQLRQLAAKGDPDALQQLVGIDFDSWKALSAEQRQRVKDVNDYTGQAGLRISQLPAEKRAAAWDDAIQSGVARGFKELEGKRGQYSDKALKDAIDGAGLVEKYISLAEPKYMVRPTDADLINVRDPEALKAAGVVTGTQPPSASVPTPTISPEVALRNATARGYAMPDEVAAIKSGLGGNGQAAFDGWLTQNKVKVVTRTGTANGRKVVQFSDGTTQYAD